MTVEELRNVNIQTCNINIFLEYKLTMSERMHMVPGNGGLQEGEQSRGRLNSTFLGAFCIFNHKDAIVSC
jgi:hypothetical protein